MLLLLQNLRPDKMVLWCSVQLKLHLFLLKMGPQKSLVRIETFSSREEFSPAAIQKSSWWLLVHENIVENNGDEPDDDFLCTSPTVEVVPSFQCHSRQIGLEFNATIGRGRSGMRHC